MRGEFANSIQRYALMMRGSRLVGQAQDRSALGLVAALACPLGAALHRVAGLIRRRGAS